MNIIVSIIVCSRNEENYIAECLQSLIDQRGISGDYEILVIDGASEDRTVEIIKQKQKLSNKVKYFENPAKVKPVAVNIGFKNSIGNYIAICDAHTVYDLNYISTLLDLMNEHPEAACVGGPITSIGKTAFGKATAIAMSSFIGVGNPKHRFPDYEGYAEMACFPLFRRDVLNTVGYYDEFFVINHDDEYCYRLRKSGGKVYLSPKAKSFYNVRNSPSTLFYQYYTYGLWQIAFLKKHKIPIAIRQLIPISFYLSVLAFIIIGLLLKSTFLALFLPAIYLIVILIFTFIPAVKKGLKIGFYFPLSIMILHFAYAVGFFTGLIKFRNYKS